MKKAAILLTVALLLAFLAACGAAPAETILTNTAVYDDMSLELRDGSITEGEDGREYLVIEAVYKNDQTDPFYALCSFVVKAFQDDVELEDCSDINGADADLIKEVRNGAEITVTYRFALNGRSAVEVLICEPTANEATLARRSYSLEG